MKTLSKPILVTVAARAAVIVAGAIVFLADRAQATEASTRAAVARDDTHILDDAGEEVPNV